MPLYTAPEFNGTPLTPGTLVNPTFGGPVCAKAGDYLLALGGITVLVPSDIIQQLGFTHETPAPVIDEPLAHGQTIVTGTHGMAPHGGGVGIYIDDVLIGSDSNVTGTTFSITVDPPLAEGDVVVARAQSSVVNALISDDSVESTVLRPDAPVVEDPIEAGAEDVSGTSTENNGTIITLYVDDVEVGTAEVAGNAWTVDELTALVADQVVTATATNEKGTSEASAGVTVTAP